MSLIARILKFSQCEVFSYLDYKGMNRWISDQTKAVAFTRAYGGEEWRGAINLPEPERRKFLLDSYKTALKDPSRGNAKYVVSFAMFDKDGKPLYWLHFCTNHLRGLEEMKKAMWAVDKTGTFRFSDKDNPEQLSFLEESYNDTWLADELSEKLAGKTMNVSGIKEYVLTNTPCYRFKEVLRNLENGKRATVVKQPQGRRSGTFPDEHHDIIQIKFELSLF